MTIEEELLKAVNEGKSDKYILKGVGNGKSFRGYIISDAETGVRVADYVYSHSLGKFELRIRTGYEKEIEAIKATKPKVEVENAILTCDSNLCVKYGDYVLNYIDGLLKSRAIDLNLKAVIQRNRDALNNGYGLAIYAASNDIEEYGQMGGFEEEAKQAEKSLRAYTMEFEKQFLALFPEGFSFNESPVYLEAQRNMKM